MVDADQQEVTLLIDGDVIAFVAASAVQFLFEDEWGFVYPMARKLEGQILVDNLIVGLRVRFKATHIVVALSDPEENFRKQIWPDYKANRKAEFKPLLLSRLKDYLREQYGAFHWAGLEADDTLGILNTEPQEYPGRRILVGRDKDFRTVPGTYYQLPRADQRHLAEIEEVTFWQAQRFHLVQTLMGDMTDGYSGCPGIGKKRAEELLDKPVILSPQPGVKTRGVNKGESTVKYVAEPTRDLWAMVVSHYRKAGQTEEDALITARLAHILQHGDYDKETGAVTLWTPDRIKYA